MLPTMPSLRAGRMLRRGAAAAALIGFALAAGIAHADFDDHPHLMAADRADEQAIQQLRVARNGDDGFGGHRDRAVRLLEQARREIHEAARFADQHR